MKREGRQHGTVRSFKVVPAAPWNPKLEATQTVAGLFAKVSSKPSNHSKFTGKCGRPRCTGCHLHPAAKSKSKSKGTQKFRASAFNFAGFSATGVLNHLDTDCLDDNDISDGDVPGEESFSHAYTSSHYALMAEPEAAPAAQEEEEEQDEDQIEYCHVGILLQQLDGDEDWCLVQELI